jgi:hypothetical protein
MGCLVGDVICYIKGNDPEHELDNCEPAWELRLRAIWSGLRLTADQTREFMDIERDKRRQRLETE